MTRFLSVLALALFIPLRAFAQMTPPPSATGAMNQMKGAATTGAAKADSAATAGAAKADSAAANTAAETKGAANAGAASAQADATKAGAKAKGAATKLLDLNSATVDELKSIPQLAPVADKIVAARPFANKSQLVSKKILDKATYDQVKALVIAKKAK